MDGGMTVLVTTAFPECLDAGLPRGDILLSGEVERVALMAGGGGIKRGVLGKAAVGAC